MAHKSPAGWVRLVNLGLLVAGAIALAWMMRGVHLREVLGSLGGWTAVLLGSSLAETALKARALHVFMRPEQRMVSYPRVFAAQLAGQAIGSVTPTGVAGEVAKTTLLLGHAPRYRAVSSVLTFNIVTTLITAAFLLLAIALTMVRSDLPAEADHALRLAFLILLSAGAIVVWMVRRGLARTVLQLLAATRLVGPERRARLMERLHGFDTQLNLFRQERQQGSHGMGVVYLLLARIVGWFDLWLVMRALGQHPSLMFTLFAAAAVMLLGSLASIVPLGLGITEGGLAGLFRLLGPGAEVGLGIGVIRRVRSLVIAACGILVMLAVQLYDHLALWRTRARLT